MPSDPVQSGRLLAEIGPRDVVIGLGHSRHALDVAAILKAAAEAGAQAIALTNSLTNPTAMVATDTLHIPQTASGPLASPVSVMAFLNAVVQGLGQATRERATQGTMQAHRALIGLLAQSRSLTAGLADTLTSKPETGEL
jgi:DNA-binding MurR/RpiR family transcriptional regulator